MCEGGKLVTEAEFVGAISSCCKGKAVILLLHFLVQGCPFWVLQTTVHIIMATSDHLKKTIRRVFKILSYEQDKAKA